MADVVGRYLAQIHSLILNPPKSLDRNDFTLEELGGPELADGARTLARVTAEAILKARVHAPGNAVPLDHMRGRAQECDDHDRSEDGAASSGAKVVVAEDLGFNGNSMEAEAWAYLAVRALHGLPLTWPTTTGCDAPVSGGVIVKPS